MVYSKNIKQQCNNQRTEDRAENSNSQEGEKNRIMIAGNRPLSVKADAAALAHRGQRVKRLLRVLFKRDLFEHVELPRLGVQALKDALARQRVEIDLDHVAAFNERFRHAKVAENLAPGGADQHGPRIQKKLSRVCK